METETRETNNNYYPEGMGPWGWNRQAPSTGVVGTILGAIGTVGVIAGALGLANRNQNGGDSGDKHVTRYELGLVQENNALRDGREAGGADIHRREVRGGQHHGHGDHGGAAARERQHHGDDRHAQHAGRAVRRYDADHPLAARPRPVRGGACVREGRSPRRDDHHDRFQRLIEAGWGKPLSIPEVACPSRIRPNATENGT